MGILNIYNVDLKYVRNLHNADSNVMSQSPQINKSNRRYLGIILLINGRKYCVPFSSGTKGKYQNGKSNVDLIKIPNLQKKNENGAYVTLSVLNINNMIPVSDEVITKFDLSIKEKDSPEFQRLKVLFQKELRWCREKSDIIEKRVQKVYSLVVDTPEKNRNLTRRCCNFKKLEAVLDKYLESINS